MTPEPEERTAAVRHVREGLVELVQEEPVGFRHIGNDQVVPVFAYGCKVFETWYVNGRKYGRWTWRYL